MKTNINLEKIKQTTIQETLLDGILETLAGLILIFYPLIFLYPIFVAFYSLIVIFNAPILEFIRNRVTYPRLGRVELKIESEEISIKKNLLELGLLLLFAIVPTLIALMAFNGNLFSINDWGRWIPMFFGIIMFGPSLYLVENAGLRRYYLFGIFATLLGFVFSAISFDDLYFRIFGYFQVMGFCLLILGIFRFLLFIKKFPVIEQEED